MKKFFTKPEANIYKLTCADVVCTSQGVDEVGKNPTETDDGLDLTQP